MSVNVPTITGRPFASLPEGAGGAGTPTPATNSSSSSTDNNNPTFQFIVGWILILTVLYFISQSRLGYVTIYYSLILMILLILVAEYKQIIPYLDAVQTIGQFNATNP